MIYVILSIFLWVSLSLLNSFICYKKNRYKKLFFLEVFIFGLLCPLLALPFLIHGLTGFALYFWIFSYSFSSIVVLFSIKKELKGKS